MGLIINGDTQFLTKDGYKIEKTDLSQVYLDLQWVTPTGTDSNVRVSFYKFRDTTMATSVSTVIQGIPDASKDIDITAYIAQAGSLMALNVDLLHDAVIDYMITEYPPFDGHITKFDPFAQP